MKIKFAKISGILVALSVLSVGMTYGYVHAENGGGLGEYIGSASSLGGTWGDTKASLLKDNIEFSDKNILVIGDSFEGQWFPKGGVGFESLNPFAKEATNVVGYGTVQDKPEYYMNKASKQIALDMGYGFEDVPVLYDW